MLGIKIMQTFLKKNLVTLIIVLATVVLAGVAIFTAIRLYQLRQTNVAPNAPTSHPAAASSNASTCQLAFTLTVASSSPSATPTLTPTPTPPPQCNNLCTTPSDCPSGMTCSGGYCRNTSCTGESSCICATATPTGTPTPTPTTPGVTPTPTPVPQCGNTCNSNSDCPSSMICYTGVCRNPSCTTSGNCICATATPTPPSIVVAPPTTTPTLPKSGDIAPTVLGIVGGMILLIAGAALIL